MFLKNFKERLLTRCNPNIGVNVLYYILRINIRI